MLALAILLTCIAVTLLHSVELLQRELYCIKKPPRLPVIFSSFFFCGSLDDGETGRTMTIEAKEEHSHTAGFIPNFKPSLFLLILIPI